MPPKAIIDFNEFPQTPILDIEGIRKYIPHRYEMEQLTAITKLDPERNLAIGYKDMTDEEFWIRGHIPGFPIYPGVLMCESGAQLASVIVHKHELVAQPFLAFGGIDNLRFRGMVRPGDRYWVLVVIQKYSQRQVTFEMQGFVNGKLIVSGQGLGIPIQPGQSAANDSSDA